MGAGSVPADSPSDTAYDTELTETTPDWTEESQSREESVEEQMLRRRRRREAMVIGGEGQPFALADTRGHASDTSTDYIDTPGTQSESERMSGEESIENTRGAAEEHQPSSEVQGTP